MIPVIALVGRPNVGKSTLFNRLTQSRSALVSDFPGLTRDRQYGESHAADRHFIVIDTGGLTAKTEDSLHRLMEKQSLQAVEEADGILFLVDARAGITPDDQLIAETLRAANKPIHLVINKAEGLELEIAAAEFHALGFKSLHVISASHAQGIEGMITTVFEDIPPAEEVNPEVDATVKLAIVGRPNVGKSTLTNRMLGEERVVVDDQPGTTRDSIFIPLERNGEHYTLIDTAGIRRRGRIDEPVEKFSVVKTLQAVQEARVVIFVINAREGLTDQDLKLLGFVLDSGRALVIAINKWDDMTQEQRDDAKKSIDRKLTFIDFADIHFISALHGTGVGNLFTSIDAAYASANKKLTTPSLTKLLIQAVTVHSPPTVNGRRVKLRYAHAGGQNPPLIIIHGNQVDAVPDAYRRYLENFFRTKLKLTGTPVRIEFRSGENPYRMKKNVLTERQVRKKRRLIRNKR